MVIQNVVKFSFGFFIGMVIEWLAIFIYKKVDPEEESNIKLILLVLMQLIIIFTLIEELDMIDDFYSRIGMISSQVFVFDYALKRFYPFKNYLKLKQS
jgi:hypothetical protein